MRRARRVALAAIFLTMAVILGMCAAIIPKERPIDCGNTTSVDRLTVKKTPINIEQMELAEVIAEVALEEFDADQVVRATEIGVMTATQESTLGADTSPDDGSTSDGPFQQIEAWGPLADRRDATKSTRMFFTGGQGGQPGLQDIDNWQSLSRGDAAQRVQASGFPDAYDQHEVESIAIVARVFGNQVTSSTQECSDKVVSPIELFVQAAINKVGTSKADATMISESADEAGFALPNSADELATFVGSEEDGVTGKTIDGQDIASCDDLERGDIVVMQDGSLGVYTGCAVAGDSFRNVTYNLQVGAGFEQRVDKARQLMDQHSFEVINFQEVENKAMFDVLASKSFLGDRYAIYPENQPPGMNRNSLGARPIVYDKTRFEFVNGSSFTFNRMHLDDPDQPAEFPILTLEDRASGQQFAFMNVHFPAFRRYAKERYMAGKAVVEAVEAQAVPSVVSGDFNSQHFLRPDSPNPTFENERDNLAYCQFTKNGLMNSTRDLAETDPRFAPGSYCPRQQGDGDGTVDAIYATSQLRVAPGGYGEINGTLTDHGHAIYADISVLGAKVNAGERSLGSYVGVSESGQVALKSLNPNKLDHVVRLTVGSSWALPMNKSDYVLTARYGETGPYWASIHTGLDFDGETGDQVYAATSGTVVEAQDAGAYGNRMIILSTDALETWYCHLSAFDLPVGTVVTAGTPIGKVGATGNVTGAHLHFEVRPGGGDPIDPFIVLSDAGLDP